MCFGGSASSRLQVLDRVQWLRELAPDAQVDVVPVFDTRVSPRNLAVVASRDVVQ